MRVLGAGAAVFCLAALTTACSGGGDTGSAGGWRVSGTTIKLSGTAVNCPTPAPVLDTFSSTPTPNPNCTPQAKSALRGTPEPDVSATPARWDSSRVQIYRSNSSGWRPIYTTYTAPPATNIYAPMVRATNQPMPTPFTTPTPTPMPTPTPLPTVHLLPTTPPAVIQPSATP